MYVATAPLNGLDLMVVGGLGGFGADAPASAPSTPSVAVKGVGIALEAMAPFLLIAGAIWLGTKVF